MTSRSRLPISCADFVTLEGRDKDMVYKRLHPRAIPTNPDVVVVGAGAAGIAAARKLDKLGVSYVMLEAANRVGGRAYTESETFGVPFDHGAHWIHSGNKNPYFKRGRKGKHRFYRANTGFRIFTDDRPANAKEEKALWEAWGRVEGAMEKAGRRGQDVAPATLVEDDGPWARTAWFGLSAWEMGMDMADFSCLDWWKAADGDDWACAAGYGTLVAERAMGLPVLLNAPVRTIRWGGSGVEVETDKGTVRGKAVIVTIPVPILASGKIRFDPPLPLDKQEALHSMAPGYYNHIALHFSQDVFSMGEDGYLLHRVDHSNEAFGALTNASGSGLAYCDVGGAFARNLELAGKDVAIDFVLSKLRGMIGSDIDKYLTKAAATEWGNNPFAGGCCGGAKPGAYPMRKRLRQAVGDRIFFAGEAFHRDLWATVGGAALSGVTGAKKVHRVLNGSTSADELTQDQYLKQIIPLI